MIFVHDYSTGEAFAVHTSDIRYIEIHSGHAVMFHTIPIQVPAKKMQGPDGKVRVAGPHVEVFIKDSELLETEQEIFALLQRDKECGIARIQAAADRAQALKTRLADPNFGGTPRETVSFGEEKAS